MKQLIKLGLLTLTFAMVFGALTLNAQNPSQLEEQVFIRINAERTQQGIPPMLWCNVLAEASRDRATDDNITDFRAPSTTLAILERINNASPEDVTGLFAVWGENLEQGPATAVAIFNNWALAGSVHRQNFMNPQFTHMGINFNSGGNRTVLTLGGGRTPNVAGVNPDVGAGAIQLSAAVITLEGSVISWPAVPGANLYDIFVGGTARDVTSELRFDLADLNLTGAVALPVHIVPTNAARTSQAPASNTVNFIPQPVLPPYTPTINSVAGPVTFEGRRYQVFDTGFTWLQAYEHAYYLGGHLATITSTAEQQFIAALLQAGNRDFYWIGGYRISNTGANQFAWVTGESVTFTNWETGEPNRQHQEIGGGEDRIAMHGGSGRWHDLLNQGIVQDGGTFERRNLGFIVEWSDEGANEDGPSIASVNLDPASLNAGETVTINAGGIEDAVRAEFIIRTAAGVETIIHTVQNPGATVVRTFDTEEGHANVNQIIVRVHDGAGNSSQASANIQIVPEGGDEAPDDAQPEPTPAPTPPPAPTRPAPQFRDTTTTDIGILLEWVSVAGNQFGYRVFRAENPTVDGVSISPAPIMGMNNFRPGNMVTFDPNVRPGVVYYYYIREVMDSAGTLGEASQRARVITPNVFTGAGAGSRGFMLMVIGNPWLNANNQWGQIDPGVGTSPIIDSGRTMVPIRAVVEAMNGTVGWDPAERRADLNALGNNVQLWLGRMDIRVNGMEQMMDIAPALVNDRTLLPLRFATESLGAQPYWIPALQMVVLVYPR